MHFFDKIKAVIHKLGGNITQELTPFEHSFLQAVHPLMRQIEANGEAQLLSLGKTLLVNVLPDIIGSGGNMGAAIAAAAPPLLKQLGDDLTQDAKNAAYGTLAIAAAQLQAEGMVANLKANPPAPAPVPTPVMTPAPTPVVDMGSTAPADAPVADATDTVS